ncbi:PpiC-type peptidyl-prolyl cis-trans isomerase [Myxococcus stipitatus DSM 14675]|uniref:PpiC-type peptidyl-prolyl cis-trans isomerase n=1 Tax=Myxococcus stipitatus (strain DSM 14675 / JCM 12634 / Mx s8) TaxID=1278073 RepID=L7UD10_MYXSD|nr:peptidyl-prolyl cis-trans isomerase [Myxococcus stipitatus]AGC45770.1 PpiC-type peptidyl-prolyl cis-trans isomerase [Myxococcus stipitatus DSM 14675]
MEPSVLIPPMRTRPTRVLSAVFAAITLSACGNGASRPSGQSAQDSGSVVAVINDRSLSAQEVKAKLDEQPLFVRSRYATTEKKKEFLDNLIRFELLVQEARRQGLENDPDVKATLEKVMVQKLLRKQQEAAAAAPLDEAELRKYYDEHRSEFTKPERIRVSHLFLAAPASDSALRTRSRAEATKILADIKSKESDPLKTAFEVATTQKSQDTDSKSTGGDLGYRSREELTQAWGAAFTDAAFALQAPAEIGQVVESDKGIHLIKFQSRQAGMDQTFEQAKPRIEARLQGERRSKSMDSLLEKLKSQAKIEVKDSVLEQIQIEGAESKPGTSQPHP